MEKSLLTTLFSPSLPAFDGLEILIEAMSARDLMLEKKNDAAKTICDRLIGAANWDKAQPAIKVFTLNLRALIHHQLKLTDLAIADYQQARDIDPNNLLALEFQADLLSKASTEGSLDRAKSALDMLISLDPENNHDRYINRSALYLKLNNAKDALADCQAALKLKPDSLLALQNASIASAALANFTETISYAERALQIDPTLGKGFHQRGIGHLGLGNESEALNDFTNAITHGYDQGDSEMLDAVRCSLFIKAKQYEEALAVCEKTLEVKSDTTIALKSKGLALKNKGMALRRLGRLAESVQAYQSALACSPTSQQKCEVFIGLSLTYIAMGNSTEALSQCAFALAEDQNSALAYKCRAWILAHLGKLDEALQQIERATGIKPVSANTQATRGFIYYLLGRDEEAKTDFDQSLAQDPAIGEALYFRAAILEKAGLMEQSSQDYLRAAELEYKVPPFSTISLPEKP